MIFSTPFKVHSAYASDVWCAMYEIVAKEDRRATKKYLTPEIMDGLEKFANAYPHNENVAKYSLVDKFQ